MIEFEKSELLFRPTVVVGLGGAGVACAGRVREKIRSSLGDVPFVQVLGIDTNIEVERHSLAKSDMVFLTKYNPNQMLQRIRGKVENGSDDQVLKRRLTGLHLSNVRLDRFPDITQGTYSHRLIGLLGLYADFREVRDSLNGKIARVVEAVDRLDRQSVTIGDKEARLALSPEGQTPFNVFIISSLGGGTGSGCFLDLAYLCRYLLRDHSSQISGVFLLPDVVRQSELLTRRMSRMQVVRSQANAYAALTELDYLQGLASWNFPYPGGLTIAEQSSPYDICYLIDAKDEMGRVYMNGDRLLDRVAQGVFNFIDPAMSQVLDRFQTNVSVMGSKWEGIDQNGQRKTSRRWYSSFNANSFNPAESEIPGSFKDYAAKRLVWETIESQLVHQPDDLLAGRNRDFLQSLNLRGIIADLATLAAIPGSGSDDRTFTEGARRAISGSELARGLEKSLKQRFAQYAESIEAEYGIGSVVRGLELLSGQTAGLNIDPRLVYSLTKLIAGMQTGINNSLASAQEFYNKAIKDTPKRTSLLGRVYEGVDHRRKIGLKIQEVQRQKLLDARVHAIAGKKVVETLEAVLQSAGLLLFRDYEVRQIVLSRLSHDLRNEFAGADDQGALQAFEGFFTENVRKLSRMELLAFWEKYFKERRSSDSSVPGLKEACVARLKPLLQGFGNIDWMEFVSQWDHFTDRSELVGRVIRKAAESTSPLLRFNTNRVPEDSTEALTVVGVSNARDKRIPDKTGDRTINRFNLVSTGREGNATVEVLSVRHGIPLAVVYSVEELRSAYNQLRGEKVSDLHVVRDLGAEK